MGQDNQRIKLKISDNISLKAAGNKMGRKKAGVISSRTTSRYYQKAYYLWLTCTAAYLCGSAGNVHAQSASPGAEVVLAPIIVSADGTVSDEIAKKLLALPGGANVVSKESYDESGNLTLSRALSEVPGVIVQTFFGGNDQPRLQIRGSGLQQNPVERGVLIMQNGLPLNRADGSYIVGFANPRQAEATEVYRGYMANRNGASVLGGALNFISPTGSSAPGTEFTISGGSFGQINVSGQAGFRREGYDGLIQFDHSTRDGFRNYNDSRRTNIGGNAGFQFNENIKTRLFFGYTNLGFDVAGPLTYEMLKHNPKGHSTGPKVTPQGAINPGPNVLRDRPRREAEQFLIGSRTTAQFDAHLFDFTVGYTYTDDMFRFPVSSGIRESKGGDATGIIRYSYMPDSSRKLPLFEASAQYTVGSMSRENYLNRSGEKGELFGDSDLDATTLNIHAGMNIPLFDVLTVSPAISYTYATRENTDHYTLSTRPTMAFSPANPAVPVRNGFVPTSDTSYDRSYNGFSPSLALSWQPNENQTVFVAASHTFEAPTHEDLLATINGTPNSSPGRPNPANPMMVASAFYTPDLDAQKALTVEGGWKGRTDRLFWDATVYYSWVDDELLNLRDVTGASLGAINANDTRHFGIELGFGAKFTEQFSGHIAYTFQDFRFHNDPLRHNNRLAGTPRHLLNLLLKYQPTEKWDLQTNVRWSPEKTPVDNMNTLFADSYVVVDFRTSYKINDNWQVFAEVTNVFDENYASSTLIVDQARADQAAFLPGDGRGFFAGMKVKF